MPIRIIIDADDEKQLYTATAYQCHQLDSDKLEWERLGKPVSWSYVEAVMEHVKKMLLPIPGGR